MWKTRKLTSMTFWPLAGCRNFAWTLRETGNRKRYRISTCRSHSVRGRRHQSWLVFHSPCEHAVVSIAHDTDLSFRPPSALPRAPSLSRLPRQISLSISAPSKSKSLWRPEFSPVCRPCLRSVGGIEWASWRGAGVRWRTMVEPSGKNEKKSERTGRCGQK